MQHTFTLLVALLNFSPLALRAVEPTPPPVLVRTARSASVLLAFDGTGDFGPQTPGTRTDGWQEALDFCVRETHDLTVKGGFGGRKPIYHIRDTIRFAQPTQIRYVSDPGTTTWKNEPLFFFPSSPAIYLSKDATIQLSGKEHRSDFHRMLDWRGRRGSASGLNTSPLRSKRSSTSPPFRRSI